MVAVTGTGAVTTDPSTGAPAVMVGGGAADDPPLPYTQVMFTSLETAGAPSTTAPATTASVPALLPAYRNVAIPAALVVTVACWVFTPPTFTVTGNPASGCPPAPIASTLSGTG